MTSVKGWIEEKIRNGYIRYFEYDEFKKIGKIGSGSFGNVIKANLENTGLVALKIIINKNSDELYEVNKELIKELKLLREVDYHPKINRCLGITKDSENYILVLEYANGGNLRKYLNDLKENSISLKWKDKIQMALDITSGLKFLHSKGIIHRDLHSKNILVNDKNLLIADLGLSKKLAEATTHTKHNDLGVVAYIEPQCFKNIRYKKDKKSDIYSLDHIKDGNRENPIEGTPPKYQELYQNCWDSKPESRPDIEKVHEILSQLSINTVEYSEPSQPNIRNTAKIPSINEHDELIILSDDNTSSVVQVIEFTNEGQTSASNLTDQLKQNELINQQAQIKISQLNQEKNNLKDQLAQTESYIYELKSQQETIIKQKKLLENELSQSQIICKQIKNENLKLIMIAKTYSERSQIEIRKQLKESELVNLQQRNSQFEQDYQNLKLTSVVQNRGLAEEEENTLQAQITRSQNEKRALAYNLNKVLKQNELINQQVKILINQLKQKRKNLHDKLAQTEVYIQKLKSQQVSLIKQKERLENELSQFQINYGQLARDKINMSNMIVGLSQNHNFFTKLKAKLEKITQLEKEIAQLEQKLINEEQIKIKLIQKLQSKENRINELEQNLNIFRHHL
ncbi:kinase-like domain-containing protein [Rhizophagus diaphanus]|nr:kinase-like domain-containing protein [Rhizophagus diaphanus] [Rhizophagus sp. MUCL 43196]